MNLNRDELEQHMHTKFNKVKDEAKKIVEDVVEDIKNEAISQLPEEPKMTGEETVEEHNTKVKEFSNFLLRLQRCLVDCINLSLKKISRQMSFLPKPERKSQCRDFLEKKIIFQVFYQLILP
ncbi:hypothetical protein RhiirC2_707079 [Rhizophagus irregularis]|uniref:Uncharacterized protein n=1 Tax=Rhizophagus irregularis TaxID=588596 RepID=A0A2N1NSE1_9GLOM|nr:hypothetical protein RhiirC2_707079 [Rhizophagus irregularis]